jgi:hypothetical protein
VHMTQYLAIVWRYNRGLTQREDRARSGAFQWFHSRGTWITAAVYVAICLGYGSVVTTVHEGRWLMTVLLAIGFTSTLMHYYFDGYIWKVRHSENREGLALDGDSSSVSWWSTKNEASRWPVFLRQLAFFGIPAAVLTVGAASVWSRDTVSYIDHMYNAYALDRDGLTINAGEEARLAFEAMERQLPVVRKLAEVQPTASREAELAYLVYNHARYENLVMPSLSGKQPDAARRARQLAGTEEAISLLESAIRRSGQVDHPGREQLTVDEARRTLASWRAAANKLQTEGLAP